MCDSSSRRSFTMLMEMGIRPESEILTPFSVSASRELWMGVVKKDSYKRWGSALSPKYGDQARVRDLDPVQRQRLERAADDDGCCEERRL